MLTEICKARGTREASLVQCASYMIHTVGCDVNARLENGCTALIIASCRGLPKLVELLLNCGAKVSISGYGRFRLCGSAKSMCAAATALRTVCPCTRFAHLKPARTQDADGCPLDRRAALVGMAHPGSVGRHTALGWVGVLLEAEEANGVPKQDRASLEQCLKLLRDEQEAVDDVFDFMQLKEEDPEAAERAYAREMHRVSLWLRGS